MNRTLRGWSNIRVAVAGRRGPGPGARSGRLRRWRGRQRPGLQVARPGDRQRAAAERHLQGRSGRPARRPPSWRSARSSRRSPRPAPTTPSASSTRTRARIRPPLSTAARTLVNDQGASCLTGPWSPDAVAQTAKDLAIPSKTLEISPVPVSTDTADLSDHDLIDSTALPESLQGSALSKAIGGALGGQQGHTVNVAASNDAYGDTISQDFIEAWQGQNGDGRRACRPRAPPLAAPPPAALGRPRTPPRPRRSPAATRTPS